MGVCERENRGKPQREPRETTERTAGEKSMRNENKGGWGGRGIRGWVGGAKTNEHYSKYSDSTGATGAIACDTCNAASLYAAPTRLAKDANYHDSYWMNRVVTAYAYTFAPTTPRNCEHRQGNASTNLRNLLTHHSGNSNDWNY